MESLFWRLFRYRSRETHRAWEDWLTESFAAVLDHDPRLGAAYTGHLIGREVETAKIETQRTFDGARPDMWIDGSDAEGTRHVVMIEHKTGGEPAEARQLRAYEKRLRKMTAETKTLVQIARTPEKPDFEPESADVRFKSFPWFKVCRWLQKQAASNRSGGESTAFVDELLKFMKERGMTIEIGMDELAACTVCKASGVEDRLWRILDAAWEDGGMEEAIGKTEGRWKQNPQKESIYWVSPTLVRHGVKVIYGFKFTRDDPEWDTETLRLPSAYVGIWEPDPDNVRRLPCPAGWKKPPQSFPDKYAWACEISELRLREGSLSASYLEFFTGAFTGLKAVLKTKPGEDRSG